MTERVNEAQVADLLALIRTDASVDTKVRELTTVKSGIKQNNVPDSCVQSLFEIARISMSAQQAPIVNAGFTTLNHLLTRLSRQEPKHLLREAARTLPFIVDKAGDQKDKYRDLAAVCLTTLWMAAPMDVERVVKNAGMIGKNSRAKETCMKWLVKMHKEHGLPFKAFVPTLMELLEDADGMVRDIARNSVIELFETAPPVAKSDLKKQLKVFNVRPAIANAITSHLHEGGHSAEADNHTYEAESRNQFSNSVASQASARPETPTMPEPKLEHVEPSYVNTQRELDDTFRDMHPFFDGKETEQNWLKREQSCTKLRRLNAGNAPSDFREAWLVGLKGLLDGILKAVNSLRTSLSKEGCQVVQEVTKTAGPGMDPMVEIMLQNLIKLCGGTKKIASQAGDASVDIIISKVSYNIRILQHIWSACQDKNVQPRTYAAGWLRTLLKKETHHKSHVEHTGGLEVIEKCIKKGLADANPGVRERMRGTYWTFASIWSTKAEAIMGSLDATQQKLLEKSPENPNSPKKAEPTTARPGMGFSKSTMGPPKPSLRETMLAQKKAAMATKNLPVRPGSAMSSFSPVKTGHASSTSSVSHAQSDGGNTRPEPTSKVAHGGLSVAPMRPTKFRPRPEIARPATAGPYSVRRTGQTPSATAESNTSPTNTRAKPAPSSVSASPPKRNIPRPNTSHSSHGSQSSHVSPARAKTPVSRIPVSPPRASPGGKSVSSLRALSPTGEGDDEGFTMVIPNVDRAQGVNGSNSPPTVTPAKSLQVYEDPFSSIDDRTTPRPNISAPVLEELPVNEEATNFSRDNDASEQNGKTVAVSPERLKQNSRLLDSGINKIKSQTLDVHGFRKLQSLIRDNKVAWTNDKFDVMLTGIFGYLQAPLEAMAPEKVQDVKTQMLSTIKLMLKKDREAFRPHVPEGMKSLLATRSAYDGRAHIVSGLDLLAEELVTLAEPRTTFSAINTQLQGEEFTVEGCRTLSMGLHVLSELLDVTLAFKPSSSEVEDMVNLAMKCLNSSESGVRMDATHLCVALHSKIGEAKFWESVGSIGEDPRSLITYYIVKRQRESARA